MKNLFALYLFAFSLFSATAQNDSLPKVKHVEPLYMDLIRDLGARRGEKELNVGASIHTTKKYTSYESFVEYEWAPINRLGFEVEVPIAFYQAQSQETIIKKEVPKNRIEGIKISMQYTFYVSSKRKISMALGYTNQLIFHSFKTLYNENKLTKGNMYSPFFVVAKNWGHGLHSMFLTGPLYEQVFSGNKNSLGYQFHTSIFQQIYKKHMVGIEVNHIFLTEKFSTILHPQVKIKVSHSLAMGFVTAIPLYTSYEPSAFVRIIFEP